MFGMIPFTREENSLWNYLDNMEKSLFTGFGDMFHNTPWQAKGRPADSAGRPFLRLRNVEKESKLSIRISMRLKPGPLPG